jgi:DNA-binding MarR family transcriptional regulator
MSLQSETNRDLVILEHIEQDPDASQATLAAQLGVAVGTINWHIKRLIDKGYVKVRRAERRKLRYIITPEGIALRARLTIDYIQTSFRMYRLVRERMIAALDQVEESGQRAVRLEGDGDVADVCRLTVMERGLVLSEDSGAPLLRIQGLKIFVDWNGSINLPSEERGNG